MKVYESREKPPIFDACARRFGVTWEHTIFTYGDTIHSIRKLSPDKMAHERVHVKQQLAFGDVEKWWELYLIDDHFRLNVEVEAYMAELAWWRANEKNIHRRAKFVDKIIRDLSSPTYGSIVSYEEAKRLLEIKTKYG